MEGYKIMTQCLSSLTDIGAWNRPGETGCPMKRYANSALKEVSDICDASIIDRFYQCVTPEGLFDVQEGWTRLSCLSASTNRWYNLRKRNKGPLRERVFSCKVRCSGEAVRCFIEDIIQRTACETLFDLEWVESAAPLRLSIRLYINVDFSFWLRDMVWCRKHRRNITLGYESITVMDEEGGIEIASPWKFRSERPIKYTIIPIDVLSWNSPSDYRPTSKSSLRIKMFANTHMLVKCLRTC